MQRIHPCLWFDHQAEEASQFYCSLFRNSRIQRTSRYSAEGAQASGQKEGSVMTVEFEIEGQTVVGLNGGPHFKFTPALSFFVWCKTEPEVDRLWKTLAVNGEVRMGLDKYPWADKYGWTADRYGVEWQIMLSPNREGIAPAFLFVDSLFGKGEEAIRFYQSLFGNSKVEFIARDEKTKSVMHSVFTLDGEPFVLMDGRGDHGYTFSPAFSLVINCDSQIDIDRYWRSLSHVLEAEQCGWLQDRYGVSWQVVPRDLGEWASDPKTSAAVMKAVLQMKKIDFDKLRKSAT